MLALPIYIYIAERHILMAVLCPSGQSGSELLNSRRKYAILGRCTQNKFADSGLKAAIIKGQYTIAQRAGLFTGIVTLAFL